MPFWGELAVAGAIFLVMGLAWCFLTAIGK